MQTKNDAKIVVTKIAIEDVQNAILQAMNSETNYLQKSAELQALNATNQKLVANAGLLTFQYCSANGRGAQSKLVTDTITKSTISRYFAVGMVINKLGAKKLVKSNVTANDINNALSRGDASTAKLEAVKNVSQLKAVLSPKHPAGTKSAKSKGKKSATPANYSSLEAWGNYGAELALHGKMTRSQFGDIAKQIVANFVLFEQNKTK